MHLQIVQIKMLKAIFGRSSSTGSDGSFPKIPSMNDFSLHTQEAGDCASLIFAFWSLASCRP